MRKQSAKQTRFMLGVLLVVVALIFSHGIFLNTNHVKKQLLESEEENAVDISSLVNHQLTITDEEVAYMKTLTFNKMEMNPINQRLIKIVDQVNLKNPITNVYVLAQLSQDEIKYVTDEENAEFFDVEPGQPLDGIWLLNGKFDENGEFIAANREDIYRYYKLTDDDLEALSNRKSRGIITEDSWGNFITGYTPLYTTSGTFVGILGVDMDFNMYSAEVAQLTRNINLLFSTLTISLLALLLFFAFRYSRNREQNVYYDFYSRLSHDMRTPMNGILGIAELSKGETDPEVLRKNISEMEVSGKYLLGLINDTLDYDKLNSGKMKLHPEVLDTRSVVLDIKNMIDTTAKEKNINFSVKLLSEDSDLYIRADGMRLKQIFVNLLSNAVKFTPPGGSVEWLLDVPSRTGSIAHNVMTVKDTGIGMSEKFISHQLFHPFSQEYNTVTSSYAGTGLGLSIVKSLVEEMGGRIEVHSKQGEGTSFIVYLDFESVDPAVAENELRQKAQPVKTQVGDLQGTHILLAEDHPLNAEIAKKLLEKQGCKVTWAEQGKAAVEQFTSNPEGTFDAILMDIRMPLMDGLEATAAIRGSNRKDATTIPIIAMTANAYPEDVQKSLDAGMNAHLAKPVDPNEMVKTLNQFIHKSEG